MADKYLLDTNAYFAILEYVSSKETGNAVIAKVLEGECFISKATQIEIISVIGKYARGSNSGVQTCERIHADAVEKCGMKYVVKKKKKWSQVKIKDWLKLEKEVSTGSNVLFNVSVLEINNNVIKEAEKFIQNALLYNFKSMDSIIVGTALANSNKENKMIVVTADKALKAGMLKINHSCISLV